MWQNSPYYVEELGNLHIQEMYAEADRERLAKAVISGDLPYGLRPRTMLAGLGRLLLASGSLLVRRFGDAPLRPAELSMNRVNCQ